MYPRLMAMFSGIGIDIILLAILITVSKYTRNSLITLLIYILLLRIIWQMRPLQKTDSKTISQVLIRLIGKKNSFV